MLRFKLILILLILFNCSVSYSLHPPDHNRHDKKIPPFTGKQLLGFQFNPLFTDDYKSAGYITSVRYGYKFIDPVTVGTELSYHFFPGDDNNQGTLFEDYSGLSIGLFARYSSPARKRIQGFIELAPLYNLNLNDSAQASRYSGSSLAIYLAPGFTLFTRNRKFSFDLYYKISTQTFPNSRHTILAYKLNYHFR
jgi:hypothetical protein